METLLMKTYLATYDMFIKELTKLNHSESSNEYLVYNKILFPAIASASVQFERNFTKTDTYAKNDELDIREHSVATCYEKNYASLEVLCLDKDYTHVLINTSVPNNVNDMLTMRVVVLRKDILTNDITYTIPQNYMPILELINAINTINQY